MSWGGGVRCSAGKGVLSGHLCFHLSTACPGADPVGPLPDRAVPASLTFISLTLVGVGAGGRDAQDAADGVRGASGVRAHRGHLRHGARGHCAEGEGGQGPAGEGAEAEGGSKGAQPTQGLEVTAGRAGTGKRVGAGAVATLGEEGAPRTISPSSLRLGRMTGRAGSEED